MAAIESVEDLAQEVQQELARLEAQIDSGAVSDVALLLASAASAKAECRENPFAYVSNVGAQHAVAVHINQEFWHLGIKLRDPSVLGSHNLIKKMDIACSPDPVVRGRTTAPDAIPDPVEAADGALWRGPLGQQIKKETAGYVDKTLTPLLG